MASSTRIDLRWLAALLLTAACAPADEPEHAHETIQLVGRVDGIDAFVGITMDDHRVFAYACDGISAGASLAAWFVAEPDGESFAGSNPSGATLEGEVSDGTATGTLVTKDGVPHDFAATTATGSSGLYFGRLDPDTPDEIWGGWIVDGSEQRGAVVDRDTGDIVGSPAIDPAVGRALIGSKRLTFSKVVVPLDETLSTLPAGG
jgi:hypothetical protein